MKINYLLIFLLFTFFAPYIQAQSSIAIHNSEDAKNVVYYQNQYPFIAYHRNYIQWSEPSAMSHFFSKLPQSHSQQVRILHIGDSHVQYDVVSGTARSRLQQIFGHGGRGLVFPLSITHTNPAFDYKSSHWGSWTYSKNVHRQKNHDLGMAGITARTHDSKAGFHLRFAEGVIKPNYTKIKVLAKASAESFALQLSFSEGHEAFVLHFDQNNIQEVILPVASRDLHFEVIKENAEQNMFELYGIIVENDSQNGILYSSTGINGAAYYHVASQNLLAIQVGAYRPDLVILDLGTNDFRSGNIHTEQIRKYAHKIIDSLRYYSPQSSILLTTAQDFFKGRDVLECKVFAQLIKEIAQEKACAFYDFYEVGGGEASMLHWRSQELSQRDLLHLSTKGYRTKGELYANAIINSYAKFLENPYQSMLLSPADTLSSPMILVKNEPKEKVEKVAQLAQITKVPTKKEEEKPKLGKITYIIKNGDNLGFLAQKFHVSTQELKDWNSLKDDKIFYGDKIVIYLDKSKAPSIAQKANYKKNDTKKSPTKHTIKRGDSLWKIANKYKVKVEDLKKLNKLGSEKLQLGQELIIK